MTLIRSSTTYLFLALFALSGALAARELSIEIRVRSTEGEVIEGAEIQISAAAGEPFATSGVSDPAGLFPTTLPDAKGQYRIQIQRVDFHAFDETVDFKGQRAPRGKPLGVTTELRPYNAVDFFNAGVELLRSKEFSGAEADFRKAVALDPALARGWGVLALIEIESGRNQEALDDATHALELDPADMQAQRTRYEALVALGRGEDAELVLSELYEKDHTEDTVRLLFNSGAKAANSGDGDLARRRLAQAIELDPKLWQAHTALAELAVREEKLQDAVTQLDLALAISPRNFKAWERKIEILRALGQTAEAEAEEARMTAARTQR